jgi:poly(ADP-ribose) glycohydrolase ARH3
MSSTEASAAGAMIREKYRGAILGAAVGDALGSVYEGTPRLVPEEIEHLLTDPHDLRYTDDTALTIAMAESLIGRSAFDRDHMAETFAAAYWAEPGRGYGVGPPLIFEQMMNGKSWRHASLSLYDGGSFGNGGAMRVSPAALFAAPDLDAVAAVAAGSAQITHAHPLGMEGAEHQAVAVALALASDPEIPLDTTAFIETLLSRVRSEEFHTALREVAELIPSGERDEAVPRLGHGVRAVQAVPVAIWCFLRNPESFVDTALCAITVGGDTDTIASMACAISGARLGESAIPEIWRARIEGRAKLQAIADALMSIASRSGAGV